MRTLSKINNLKYCLRQNYAQIIYRIYLINYSILLLISSRLLYVLFFFLCDLNSSVVNNFVIVYGEKKNHVNIKRNFTNYLVGNGSSFYFCKVVCCLSINKKKKGRVQVFFNSTIYLLALLHFFKYSCMLSCDFVLILFMPRPKRKEKLVNVWLRVSITLCGNARRTSQDTERTRTVSLPIEFLPYRGNSVSIPRDGKFKREATRGDVLGAG